MKTATVNNNTTNITVKYESTFKIQLKVNQIPVHYPIILLTESI